MSKVAERIQRANRAELERMAGAVLREMARASLRKYRDIETGMRECSQIMELALRLEQFAGEDQPRTATEQSCLHCGTTCEVCQGNCERCSE